MTEPLASIISFLGKGEALSVSLLFFHMLPEYEKQPVFAINYGAGVQEGWFFYIFVLSNTNPMNTTNIFQQGFPQELISIPYGEIFLLTNPNIGITSKNIFMMQFIFSMARQYGKNHIVKERPVDSSELWDCCVCKVKQGKGCQLLIADNASLVEMLSEFWGLDYEEVCKTINIPQRNKEITCGGDGNLLRLNIIPSKTEKLIRMDENTFTLQCIPVASRDRTMAKLTDAFQEMFSHGIDVSFEDISDLYEKLKNSRKTYRLDIQINEKVGFSRKNNPKTCDIKLIDNSGKEYPLEMEPLQKALYLTFILFKDGVPEKDVNDSPFYDIFLKIQDQLSRNTALPSRESLFSNTKHNLSVIRTIIWKATNDTSAKEQFAVDGYSGEPYKVAGATDAHRELIRKGFGIE